MKQVIHLIEQESEGDKPHHLCGGSGGKPVWSFDYFMDAINQCKLCLNKLEEQETESLKWVGIALRRAIFEGYTAGKKQKETPYDYTLDADKIGEKHFRIIKSLISTKLKQAIKQERSRVVEENKLRLDLALTDLRGIIGIAEIGYTKGGNNPMTQIKSEAINALKMVQKTLKALENNER